MRTILAAATIAIAIGSAGSRPAADAAAPPGCELVVDARGSTPYRTIQAAVDALPNPGPCRVVVRAGSYREPVVVAGKNTLAASDDQRIRIVGNTGAIVHPDGDHGFIVTGSTRIDIEGFVVTGASQEAIVVTGGGGASQDVTIARNDLHNNGSAAADGGVLIESGSVRTWVANNLIRQNGHNGLAVRRTPAAGSGSTYVVNNTIFGQGWNGVSVDRGEDVSLVNNLIAGNGTDRGTTGGRWGLVQEKVAGGGAPALIILRNNILYRNGGTSASASDVGNAAQILDEADSDNLTTAGLEGSGVAGCAVPGCLSWPFSAVFAGSGYGPRFRLAAASPAIGRGLDTFTRDGREWIPLTDFEGTHRRGAAIARTPSTVDIGHHQSSRQLLP